MRRKSYKYDKKTAETVVYIMLAIFILPFVGIKLMGRKSPVAVIFGAILTVVGFAVWVKLAAG